MWRCIGLGRYWILSEAQHLGTEKYQHTTAAVANHSHNHQQTL